MGMLQEFKEFAMRGNVADMAIGVVIGAAFGKIVTSFTNDLLMPPIGHAHGRNGLLGPRRDAEGADRRARPRSRSTTARSSTW